MTSVVDVVERARAGIAWPPVLRRADLRLVAASILLFDVGVLGLSGGQRAPIDGYGLISALPWSYLAAISGLVGMFLFALLHLQARGWALYVLIIVLVVALALAPALLEPFPRFATSWTHAGFTDYIGRTGRTLPNYDARFSWPGFFAAAAAFAASAGVGPLSLLRWAPLVLDLLYLFPLAVIVGCFTADPRRRALAVFVFVVGNWVGQDYFAPQGLNYLLFLVFGALLLRVFATDDPNSRIGRLVTRALARREPRTVVQHLPLTPLARIGLLCLLLGVYTASVVSHQLTQVFMLFLGTALVLLGASRLRGLPVVLAVISTAYFMWGAAAYWTGHLHGLLNGLGHLGISLQQNVTARAAGSLDPAREVVIWARMGITAFVWLLAVLGLARARTRALVVPAVLAAIPFLVLGLQSFGGEALLRVHLFSLPFVAVLAAHVLPPSTTPTGGVSRRALGPLRRSALGVALAALSVTLPVGFMLARYGNESFEQMTTPDVDAVRQLYATAPLGSVLFGLNDAVPWKYRDLGSYGYANLSPLPWVSQDPASVLAGMLRAPQPTYLLLTEAQWTQAREMEGVDPGRIADAQHMIETTPLLRRQYGAGPTGIYVLSGRSS